MHPALGLMDMEDASGCHGMPSASSYALQPRAPHGIFHIHRASISHGISYDIGPQVLCDRWKFENIFILMISSRIKIKFSIAVIKIIQKSHLIFLLWQQHKAAKHRSPIQKEKKWSQKWSPIWSQDVIFVFKHIPTTKIVPKFVFQNWEGDFSTENMLLSYFAWD